MKRILAFILLLTVSIGFGQTTYAPLQVNKTNTALPPSSTFFNANSNVLWSTIGMQVGLRAVLLDPDADSYAWDVGCADLDERVRISQFVQGLKDMGLWCNAKLLVSFRTNHQATTGNAIAIKGPLCTVNGSPTRSGAGFTFDGSGGAYLTFTNQFSGSITTISAVVSFKSNKSTKQAVVSGYGNSPNKSFGVYVHGGPGAGDVTNAIEMTLSADGSASLPLDAGRYMADYSATAQRQMLFCGFSTNSYSSQANGDLRRTSTTNGTFGTLYNPQTTWEIARSPGGGTGFNGEIAFVGLWERYLSEYEYLAIRRLYTLTIGRSYAPEINVIIEGDSITAGGGTNTGAKLWSQQLIDNGTWGPLVSKRNIAEGGTTAATMLSTIHTQALHYALDGRFYGRGYFMLNGGLNDLLTTNHTTTFVNLSNAWARARAIGLRVVAFTITPSASYTAGQATERLNLNQMIRTNTTLFDYLVDLGTNSLLTNTANATYFQSDGVHLQEAGQTAVLNNLLSVIPTP